MKSRHPEVFSIAERGKGLKRRPSPRTPTPAQNRIN